MSKRPSLFHQFLTSLREQERFGKSKHTAKKLARFRAQREGQDTFGIAPNGIYSINTFAAYRQVAREFSDWCKENGNPRYLEEAKYYAGFYLQYRIDRGLSAWTIQRDRSALRKIFKDDELCWEIEVPKRRIKDIKRSRGEVEMDKYFNSEEHKDLVDFCLATGLRRHELEVIRPKDIYYKGNKLVAYVAQGKGGKAREVTVLKYLELRVLFIVKGKEPDKPIFNKIPKAMDVHSYRADYATSRLEEAEKIEVSRDLGHNRTDIIGGHYTRK